MDILIVEDDPVLGSLWKTVVERAGHAATLVDGAVAARKLLLLKGFDMLLLDLNLGSESGLSVATMAGYQNPDCRTIIITGSALFPRGELFAMDRTIVSVLRKPVDVRDLIALCDHHAENLAEAS